MDCLFCKIINKELPAEIIYQDDKALAFKDIHPKAPIHLLIVPKQHINSISSEGSEEAAKDLILAAKAIAKEQAIDGYKLIFNIGRSAGQTINHLHLHLLAGKISGLPVLSVPKTPDL